jgi:hypothetical protein
MKYALFFLLAIGAPAQTLHYVINWPSGLSLGEGSISSTTLAEIHGVAPPSVAWTFDLDLDAGVPGFTLRDHYHSTARDAEICSVELTKKTQHGARKSDETVTFDQTKHTVTREWRPAGGKGDYSVPACARDALAFLQFARKELAQGRLVPQQQVVLGAAYNIRLEVLGTATVKMLGKPVQADRIRANIKGPASNLAIEIFFAKDEVRTPVLAKIPLPLGTFTVELTR